ncbi:MAG: gliding motility-associated C-terminal domain-containing protein [Flavobacteriales bacterium]|nr:gliding motility-associated C-terminal domain-containing protein [Flavobacteriales bacterium]
MKKSFIIIVFTMLSIGVFSQPKWTNSPNSERAFVENKGQYDGRNWQSTNQIKYALSQQDGWFTFFSNKGITHRIERLVRNPKKKKGEGDANNNLPSRIHLSEFVNISFVGANNNVKIIAEEKTNHYYSYAVKDLKTNDVNNINNVKGYKKITYKNIYNNIDIEYTLHPDGGIKYNVILHPGANPNEIKMKYETFHTNHLDEKIDIKLNSQTGQLEINTASNKIIEHKPLTFYQNSKTVIQSEYAFSNNILTFNLGNYDNSQKVVIDPWVVTPNFNAGDFTREVETDATGNVYVIGGEIPMELRKYGIAGNLIWTYITPWDTNGGDWLGTLATDAAGVSYITQGTGAEIERVSTAGAMVWHANATGIFNITEYWTITFNCDNTKLIVGGTGGTGLNFQAKIYDMDLSNGSVLADVTVGTQGGFTPVEVRSIAPTKNSKYVYLTHTEVGAINQNLTACSSIPDFQVDNTHHLGYKCENYLSASQNGGGLKAIIANDNFFYTHRGDRILQWDINTGALLNNVALPGGSSNNTFGRVVHCSGLDVDATGNVYAGSMDRVVKFDPNLNILSQVNTTGGFTVYDVSVNSNGEVLAVGALLNNSTSTGRGGRIESLNMTAGSQYATVCCDPNFCPINTLCTTDAPVSLNPNTPGGVWSSTPTTPGLNTLTGVFDPSVSGAGNFVVTYTLGCGSFSYTISVNVCSSLSVCVEANGDLTVSNGTPVYTWDQWTPPSTITVTNQTQCTSCGGTWTFGSCYNPFPIPLNSCNAPGFWTTFTTGSTITPPPGIDTLRVTDSFGNFIIINGLANLPACNPTACDATITAAGPFCENDAPVTLSAVDPGGAWSGTGITNTSTGIFDPGVAGPGSHIITYSITGSCTDTDTETIVVNAQDDASFGYSPTTFCTTDPNPTPTITGTSGGTFTIDNSGVINASTGEVNITGSGIGAFNITYTTNGTCPDTSTVTINITSGADATITAAGPFCENAASVTLSAVDPGGVWSGTGITNTSTGTFDPSTAGAGTHQIIYTISGSCGDADTISIVVDAQDDASFSYSPTTFCTTDPNPTPTITGTSGGTFTIDNSGVINASTGEVNITGSGAGVFNVTYTTNGACPDTSTVSININNCTLPQPIANFSASQTNICEGNCINFIDLSTSSATGGITAWSWTFNGGTPSTSNQQNPTNVCFAAAGTYTISLTVTDANGSDDSTMTAYITVTNCTTPTAGFSISDNEICAGECIDFTDMSTAATSWLWTFNGGSPSTSTDQNPTNICFGTDGVYSIELIASNSFGSDTITDTVTVHPTPIVNAGSNVTITLGNNTILNATGSNGSYSWTPPTWLSCPTCPSTTSTPEETITYTVIVVDSNGCSASDQVTVFIEFENVIWVPNIFSPNGDGSNDILYVRGKGVADLNFFVYDRWGEKVFETTSLDIGWDGKFRGKDMNKAVFVYYLEATFIDGSKVTKKGDVTLIR